MEETIKQARIGKKLDSMTIEEIKLYVKKLEELVNNTEWAKKYLELIVNSTK